MNWKEMEIFKGIDLNDTFVLSWNSAGNELNFALEASIWPESEFYEKPKKEEYTCYKPARLRFKNIKNIHGLLSMDEAVPSTDASGEKDYGNIESLVKTDDGFSLEGDFGSVTISCGEMSFEIKET